MKKIIHNFKGISHAEILFVLLMVFLTYALIMKPMIDNFIFTNLKTTWVNVFVNINIASKGIGPAENKFSSDQSILDEYGKFLLPTKVCIDARTQGCWSSNWVLDSYQKPGMVFADGAFLVPNFTSTSCDDSSNSFKTCGYLIIDSNGIKGPNKIGQDILKVYLLNNEIKPAGIEGDVLNPAYNCVFGKTYDWGCSEKYLEKI